MRSLRLALVLGLVGSVGLGCGDDDGPASTDAGALSDAQTADVNVPMDAPIGVDAPTGVDAGVDVDATVDMDANVELDAGEDVDATVEADAGTGAGTDASADAATGPDGGPAACTHPPAVPGKFFGVWDRYPASTTTPASLVVDPDDLMPLATDIGGGTPGPYSTLFAVSAGPEGEVGIAFVSLGAGALTLYHARIDAVETPGAVLGAPSVVAMLPSGTVLKDIGLGFAGTSYVMAWMLPDGVHARAIGLDGVPEGDALHPIATETNFQFDVVSDGDGIALAFASVGDELQVARLGDDATLKAGPTRIDGSFAGALRDVSIETSGERLYVTYVEAYELHFAALDRDAALLGTHSLGTVCAGSTCGSDMSFYTVKGLVWTGCELGVLYASAMGASAPQFYLARLDSNGGRIGTDRLVLSGLGRYFRWASLGWDGAAHVVLWNDITSKGVVAARIALDGTTTTVENPTMPPIRRDSRLIFVPDPVL